MSEFPDWRPVNFSVPHRVKVTTCVQHGEIKLRLTDDTWYVEYHNPIFVRSPFKMPTQFSSSFSMQQVLGSGEVAKFLDRFKTA